MEVLEHGEGESEALVGVRVDGGQGPRPEGQQPLRDLDRVDLGAAVGR